MIRFGIVGTGRISDWVLQGAIQDPRFQAVAVCSRKADTAAAFISSHPQVFGPDAKVFTSIEAMAACPEVDAVYIGTPNTTHCPYTLAAIAAGKHVLCEKPLGCNLDEVERMVGAARAKGVLLMEAMISTLNPFFRALKEEAGKIGPIRGYETFYCQRSSKLDNFRKGIIAPAFDPRLGGGALEDLGIYTVYTMLSILGEPAGVRAEQLFEPTPYGPIDVEGHATLAYPGFNAEMTYSKMRDAKVPTTVTGAEGSLSVDEIHICAQDKLKKNPYFYEFEEFIGVLESGRRESAVNSHTLALAVRRVMDSIHRQV